MAITIISSPPNIHFSRNEVEWNLSTNQHLITAGVAAQFDFVLNGNDPVPGDTVEIEILGQNLVFTCAAVPDDSGFQFPERPFGYTYTDYALLLHSYFIQNYYIDKYFTAVHSGVSVLFTANEIGSQFNPVFNVPTFGNFVINTLGTDDVFNENFDIGVDVMVETSPWSQVYERIDRRGYRPDENQAVQFDLQKILHPFVSSSDIVPVPLTAPQACTKVQRRYYLKIRESYGNPKLEKKVTDTTPLIVHKGGLRSDNFIWVGRDPFAGLIYPEMIFLSAMQKVTTVTCREVLHWNCSLFAPHYLLAKVYYNDGSDSGDQTIFTFTPNDIPETWMIPASFNHIGLGSFTPTGLKPVKYELWLTDGTNPISGTVTFLLTEDIHLQKTVYYENSYGVYELMRLTGTQDLQIEVSKREFEAIAKIHYDYTDRQVSTKLDSYQFIGEAFTGIFRRNELGQLIDFLKSETYFDIDGFIGRPYGTAPFYIMKDSFSILRDDDYNFQAKFKFRYSNKEENFTDWFI
jgi:hypothetical protein